MNTKKNIPTGMKGQLVLSHKMINKEYGQLSPTILSGRAAQ